MGSHLFCFFCVRLILGHGLQVCSSDRDVLCTTYALRVGIHRTKRISASHQRLLLSDPARADL